MHRPSLLALCSVGKLGSYRICQVGCRVQSMAGEGVFPQGTRSPQSGQNTDLDQNQSRGWGRTETCRLVDRPDTSEYWDTQRLQEETQTCQCHQSII